MGSTWRLAAATALWMCFAGGAAGSSPKPDFRVEFSLVDLGIEVFDSSKPDVQREAALKRYLEHPLMAIAFQRYSSSRRPPEQRVDAKVYEDFVRKVWKRDFESVTHPRLKHVSANYKWGIGHIPEIKKDSAQVRSSIEAWLNKAVKKIPFGTPAAELGKTPVKLVFLFDPGGSYPWVHFDSEYRYIYFDVLQLRGLDDKERASPIDPDTLHGFLIHELFHQFQKDKFEGADKGDWLIQTAISEGSAMLIGNNAFDQQGQKFHQDESVLLGGRALREWQEQMPRVCDHVASFLKLVAQWKKTPPSDDDYYKTISKESWVATPDNGLLFGNVYRVGAQMLMDIKVRKGLPAFYEVVGDSGKLLTVWEGTSRCKGKTP